MKKTSLIIGSIMTLAGLIITAVALPLYFLLPVRFFIPKETFSYYYVEDEICFVEISTDKSIDLTNCYANIREDGTERLVKLYYKEYEQVYIFEIKDSDDDIRVLEVLAMDTSGDRIALTYNKDINSENLEEKNEELKSKKTTLSFMYPFGIILFLSGLIITIVSTMTYKKGKKAENKLFVYSEKISKETEDHVQDNIDQEIEKKYKVCEYCGYESDINARKCERCGADFKFTKKR